METLILFAISIVSDINKLLEFPLTKVLGWLFGAWLVYRFGLLGYFKQREYEEVRKRYLDEGLDLACAQIDYALSVFRFNWQLYLRYIKLFRELETPFETDDFFNQFQELDQSKFLVFTPHRIHALLPNTVIWDKYQSVFAFVGKANERIKADFGTLLKELGKNPKRSDKDEIVAEADKQARELADESDRHYIFVSELNNLARILDLNNIKRTDINSFSKRKDVIEIMDKLMQLFPKDDDDNSELK